MKTLKHNQTIRVSGFPAHASEITVRTLRGYCEKNGEDYAASLQRSIARNDEIAWTLQATSVIEADYEGKNERLAAAKARIASGEQIEAGETVEIEGVKYRVKINGLRYSDPVVFVPLEGVSLSSEDYAAFKQAARSLLLAV